MRYAKAFVLVVALLPGLAWAADEPGGIVVAGSEPQAATPTGTLNVLPGRFVPLTVAGGKPALVLGNDAGLVQLFDLPKDHSIIGIRYDEPVDAVAKQYTFPKGAVKIALAGNVGGSVTLTSVINGKTSAAAPTVDGKLVLTLTGPRPPPPGPVDPVVPVDPVIPQPVKSFRVIFVKESGATLSAGQSSIPGAKSIRDYLAAKTTPEGGVQGWREYDPQSNVPNEQPGMKALWDAVKPKLTTTPCAAVEVNGKVEIIPYEKDAATMLAKLKTYGGN